MRPEGTYFQPPPWSRGCIRSRAKETGQRLPFPGRAHAPPTPAGPNRFLHFPWPGSASGEKGSRLLNVLRIVLVRRLLVDEPSVRWTQLKPPGTVHRLVHQGLPSKPLGFLRGHLGSLLCAGRSPASGPKGEGEQNGMSYPATWVHPAMRGCGSPVSRLAPGVAHCHWPLASILMCPGFWGTFSEAWLLSFRSGPRGKLGQKPLQIEFTHTYLLSARHCARPGRSP